MEFLEAIHGVYLDLRIAPNLTALLTLALFVWSLLFFVRPEPTRGFKLLTRVTAAWVIVSAISGIILHLTGERVPSAVPGPAGDRTVYGFPPDPVRHWEHIMYAFFVFLSLGAMEVIMAGRLVDRRYAMRFMPVVTLFLYGVAYMVGRVTVFPGSSVE